MTTELTLAPTAVAPHGLAVRTRGLVHVYRGEGRDVAIDDEDAPAPRITSTFSVSYQRPATVAAT